MFNIEHRQNISTGATARKDFLKNKKITSHKPSLMFVDMGFFFNEFISVLHCMLYNFIIRCIMKLFNLFKAYKLMSAS